MEDQDMLQAERVKLAAKAQLDAYSKAFETVDLLGRQFHLRRDGNETALATPEIIDLLLRQLVDLASVHGYLLPTDVMERFSKAESDLVALRGTELTPRERAAYAQARRPELESLRQMLEESFTHLFGVRRPTM